MADSAQISNKLRPPCTKCGKPLLLTRREPEKPGFELRVCYCASCGASDRVIAPLFGRGRLRTYADLNLWVAKVHQYLIKVAQIEPLPAARTCREMIGLAFGDAIRIEA